MRNLTLEARILRIFRRLPIGNKSLQVVDIGCGTAGYWQNLLSALQSLENSPRHVSLTLADAVDSSQTTRRKLTEQFQAFCQVRFESVWLEPRAAAAKLRDISLDSDADFLVITSFSVLEHLEKSSGWLMLYDIDYLASEFEELQIHKANATAKSEDCRAASVVGVPNGFVYQPPALDNSHNSHISEWTVKDLKAAGYRDIRAHSNSKFRLGALEGGGKGRLWTALKLAAQFLDAVLLASSSRLGYEIIGVKTLHGREANRFTA